MLNDSSKSRRILLVAAKTGYQVREFGAAAEHLGVELVLATDRCHVLDDPWGDRAVPLQFANPAAGMKALAARGPFDGILAVGDEPASVAAKAARRLGLRFHPVKAAHTARNKSLSHRCFRSAGLLVPGFRTAALGVNAESAAWQVRYPCVLKPLDLSGSRGVIRADNHEGFMRALQRTAAIIKRARASPSVLIEEFVPGLEFALEGVVTAGRLQTLALFDKPDPLDGPFFEETIYVTPSRQPASVRGAIRATVQRAVTALGLSDGPVHAEVRVNDAGVWMLEAAARPIGGLCARALRFHLRRREIGLEELLLRHALGENVSTARLVPGEHAVMMIPIPKAGVYQGVEGLETARSVRGIYDITITAKEGQMLEPLPEGSSYLGFIFAHGSTPKSAETSVRRAYQRLKFLLSSALPVVR